MSDPEVRSLHLRLHGEYFDARRAETVGALAAIVAMVRVNDDRSVAKRLATADNPFSFVRFRRLLETNDLADLMYGMRQVVRFLDDRANVADLAWSIYQWNDRDNSQRLRWAYDYG